MSSVKEVLRFYNSLLHQVNNGKSISKALRHTGKDFTALRRVRNISELYIVRRQKFNEVCSSIMAIAVHYYGVLLHVCVIQRTAALHNIRSMG